MAICLHVQKQIFQATAFQMKITLQENKILFPISCE